MCLTYGFVYTCRIRKRFHVLNVGNGPLELGVETSEPWCVVTELVGKEAITAEREGAVGLRQVHRSRGGANCGGGCWCDERLTLRDRHCPLHLEPRSCVEVACGAGLAGCYTPG